MRNNGLINPVGCTITGFNFHLEKARNSMKRICDNLKRRSKAFFYDIFPCKVWNFETADRFFYSRYALEVFNFCFISRNLSTSLECEKLRFTYSFIYFHSVMYFPLFFSVCLLLPVLNFSISSLLSIS